MSADRRDQLLPPKAREARRDERRQQLLRFLRTEIWSSAALLGQVMGIGSPQGIHKALVALEQEGLISRATLPVAGRRPLTAWGITSHGQALAFDLAEEQPLNQYFEPGRVSLSTVAHHLAIQRLRLRAEAAGWQDWTPGSRLGKAVAGMKRPDAIALSPDGQSIAVEYERLIKTPKRYAAIMSAYLQAIKQGHYVRVDYVCPSAELATRLARIIQSTEAVPVRGTRVRLQSVHYQLFNFYAEAQWPDESI